MEHVIKMLQKSVRPVITYTLAMMVIALTYTGKIEPREILLIFASLISYWFGERSALKTPGREQQDNE